MVTAPRQCAAVLLSDEQGRILLVQQNYGGRFWGFAEGVVDAGETPLQAAVREAAEEAAVEVELSALIGLYTLQGGGWPDVLASVFLGKIRSGTPSLCAPDEIAALEWLAPQQVAQWLGAGLLLPDVEAALEDYLAGRLGVVRTVQRKVNLPPLAEL